MARTITLLLTVAGGLALGGCVAGMLASAAGTAVQAARGAPESNVHLQPTAKAACSSHAVRYGAVLEDNDHQIACTAEDRFNNVHVVKLPHYDWVEEIVRHKALVLRSLIRTGRPETD